MPVLHPSPFLRVHLQEITNMKTYLSSPFTAIPDEKQCPERSVLFHSLHWESQASPDPLVISKCVPLAYIRYFFSIETCCWYYFMYFYSCFCWPNSWLPLAKKHKWMLAGNGILNKPNLIGNHPSSVLFVWLCKRRLTENSWAESLLCLWCQLN